jgi:hypothetical protein
MKKRIKSKHQHHEEVIRHQIEEEIFQDKNVFFEKKLQEATEKYLKRIDYLVGGNNELASLLKITEDRCRELEKNREGCIHIPNATADCIVLEENF